MAQSIVDCCNNALQMLGQTFIMSLTDGTRTSRQCQMASDNNRRAELRKYNWNFAKKRIVLAPDTIAPAFHFKYQFTLPSDCLRIIIPRDATLDWSIEGKKILTNEVDNELAPTLNLCYTADITDPSLFDGAFYDMYSTAMAIDMCEAITNSTSKKAALERQYDDALQRARLANAFEELPEEAPDDTFWTCRY